MDDERYRSGEAVKHRDGRQGTIVRPGGRQYIIVRFGNELERIHIRDLLNSRG